MNVLVTGGAGYIGTHTCVELLNRSDRVIVLDNYVNSSPAALRGVEQITGRTFPVYEADLMDYNAVKRVFCENQIDAVIDFAGLKAVGESVSKPLDYYRNNLIGTLNLLEVMKEHDVKKLVFSSSATVYGMNNEPPFREDMPRSTTNPYGATKLMIEDMLRDLCYACKEWSVVLLRYFNPIGAHESGLIGENPNGIPNNLMPYIVKVAAGELPCLSIYGGDYPTPDGTCIRDYIHVYDLAMGHLKALEYLGHMQGAEAINLGTGKGYSVLEVVQAFERATGRTVNHKMAPRREGDIAACYADVSKARELLHWEAVKTLEEMCRDSWNFAARNGARQ